MTIQKEARMLLKTLVNDYEVFSSRLPLCDAIQEQIEKEFPTVPTEVIASMLEHVKNSKDYKSLNSEGYPAYDLYGNACNSNKVKKPVLALMPHRRSNRPETPHKAKVHIRHSRRLPPQDKRLESV